MGLLLFDSFEPQFVLVGDGSTIFARAETNEIVAKAPMTQPYIPSWGIKDPDDRRPKNYSFARVLLDAGNPTIDAYSVIVTGAINAAGEAVADDGSLVIFDVAWDSALKRVGFRWRGGTLGWMYLVTARVASGSIFSADQSGWVQIGNK